MILITKEDGGTKVEIMETLTVFETIENLYSQNGGLPEG